jgi:hypothetical protein
MERTVDNENWTFRDLEQEDSDDYGGVTSYVVEHNDKPVALRIGLSEGLHIMECERGSWQVDMGHNAQDYQFEIKCFNNETDALDYAIRWVDEL